MREVCTQLYKKKQSYVAAEYFVCDMKLVLNVFAGYFELPITWKKTTRNYRVFEAQIFDNGAMQY